MKITNMVFDLLMEQAQNKKLLKFCLNKWYGETPTEEEQQNVEDYLNKFFQIKPKLSIKNPGVRVFLNNYPNFDVERIKNVEHYTLKEVSFLLGEFFDFDESTEKEVKEFPDIFDKENYDNETYEESKKLWYGKNQYLIIDEGDVRVYKIDRREVSRNFGYYDRYLIDNVEPYKSSRANNTWCIGRTYGNNMWSSYRDRRAFYFIIDETKSPEIEKDVNKNQYYLSVLQACTDSNTKFRLTPILNDGTDPAVNEEQIFKIYPKLRGHLDKIKYIPYNETYEIGTVKNVDIINLINENENSPNEFAKQTKNIRTRYIQRGRLLTKKRSWDVLDEEQKRFYINSTTERDLYEKFNTKELLFHIKTIKQDYKSLDNKIKFLGINAGFNSLLSKLLTTDYIVDVYKSLRGNVSVYKSRTTGKFGLFDTLNCTWLNRNGIQYDDEYVTGDVDEFDADIFNDTEDVLMIAPFKKPTGIDETAFMFFTDSDDDYNGYFVSYANWLKIKEQMDKRKEDVGNDPENDNNDKYPYPKFDGNDDEQADLNELDF